ncbi:MAG: hypothetical protein ACOX7K_04920 [Oscillospiraceae bacterium]|jgi:hypothetical protein
MNDYKIPYYILFNGISDALHELENLNISKALELLVTAQQKAEEEFIKD